MTTSQHLARIRYPASWPTDNHAISPVNAGDVAINNVNHYSDVFGQCRANFVMTSQNSAGYRENTSGLTDSWAPVWTSGPFPIALNTDGTPYKVRVHVAAAKSTTSAETASVAVVISRVGDSRAYITGATAAGTAASDSVWVSNTFTSSTAAYLSGASQGAGAYTSMVAMSADEGSRAMAMGSTITKVAGSGVGVLQCLVELTVYMKHDDASKPGRLYAFSAWEVP